MIQSCWVAVGSRSRAICGSAKLSTVLSTETSSTGSMSTTSASPAAPADAAGATCAAVSVVRSIVAGQWWSSCRLQLLNRPAGIVSESCDSRRRYDQAHEPPPACPRERARRVRGDPHRRRRTRGDDGCHGPRRGRVQGRAALPLRLEGCARSRASSSASTRWSTRTSRAIDDGARGPDRLLPAVVGRMATRSTARSSPPHGSRRAATPPRARAIRSRPRALVEDASAAHVADPTVDLG